MKINVDGSQIVITKKRKIHLCVYIKLNNLFNINNRFRKLIATVILMNKTGKYMKMWDEV